MSVRQIRSDPGWMLYSPGGLLAGDRVNFNHAEVETMRTRITLACTECKRRNYDTTKDKKTHPDRMEIKKYCRFCRKHTTHKETK